MISALILAHHINSLFCLSIGVSLNILLIWLIFKQTPKEKQIYSQILLQTCIIDILLLIMGELVQPIFFVQNGVAKDIMIGQLSFLPNPFYHFVFIVWFIIFYFSLIGLGIQFIYRYLILCK
ncbi:unnamed protein product [Meloidogyne enterolobii]|uniref:Uncharacterized protein n=1 Tax=Meloidogyne enterolobii TaxID=390850 RepID=A0ACB0ZV85_MELEN